MARAPRPTRQAVLAILMGRLEQAVAAGRGPEAYAINELIALAETMTWPDQDHQAAMAAEQANIRQARIDALLAMLARGRDSPD